ncbi:hypothetical protein BN1012_Phect2306 [Candidatus Phaeomarinobacter ectocarpi]|uniref:Abasic site processing protein n=2 Tax=Candidatus Phaeomarinibacter ectocarpi TaxID=1458461 RepID=X5MGD8_9HYPH|nr:hypothetical protein BN1012_Phect2306 [Candidatus Phaeomarinobacter ectocarpi]
MAFAGIWEHWQSPEGSELESCSIITTQANATLAPVHHRMPVILNQADWETWIDTSETLGKRALELLVPSADDLLDIVPVSTRVNAVANDDAALQDEVDPVQAEPPAKTKSDKKPDDQMTLF